MKTRSHVAKLMRGGRRRRSGDKLELPGGQLERGESERERDFRMGRNNGTKVLEVHGQTSVRPKTPSSASGPFATTQETEEAAEQKLRGEDRDIALKCKILLRNRRYFES